MDQEVLCRPEGSGCESISLTAEVWTLIQNPAAIEQLVHNRTLVQNLAAGLQQNRSERKESGSSQSPEPGPALVGPSEQMLDLFPEICKHEDFVEPPEPSEAPAESCGSLRTPPPPPGLVFQLTEPSWFCKASDLCRGESEPKFCSDCMWFCNDFCRNTLWFGCERVDLLLPACRPNCHKHNNTQVLTPGPLHRIT